MDHLYDLVATDDPNVWRLPITPELCAGPDGMPPFLYGGMGLAAGIGAMQRVVGRPLIWASAQYLSYALLGQELELTVEVPSLGRTVAHARVTGRVGAEEIITAVGSLGTRETDASFQWSRPDEIPPPADCEPLQMWPKQGSEARVIERMEARMEAGVFAAHAGGQVSDDGRISLWMRTTEEMPVDPGVLAMFADFVPAVLALSMGRLGGGSSLDNTLRIVKLVPTRWVLCVIDAHGVDHGMGHGDIHLYAETGELLAVGSQSCLMRFFGCD